MRPRRQNDELASTALREALYLLALILAGCDTSEWDRIRERSRVNEQIRIGCLPVGQEKVVVAWRDGNLTCWRYTPDQSKHRRMAVEARVVATAEEILE